MGPITVRRPVSAINKCLDTFFVNFNGNYRIEGLFLPFIALKEPLVLRVPLHSRPIGGEDPV